MDVQPGLPYVIRLVAPSGTSTNSAHWRSKSVSGEYHPRYWQIGKTNTYYTTSYNYQPMFRARGTALAELEYGGCEVFGLNIANPNGQFNIRRLFRNESGGTITVSEYGIYSVGSFRMVSDEEAGGIYSFCIGRDLISPAINVLNGEDLAVTYTPQITV